MEERIGTLNVGSMNGLNRELALLERRSVDILSVHENRWKGKKATNIGGR